MTEARGLRRVDRCPSCGQAIDTDPRYASWCDSCDWNLVIPDRDARPPGRIARFYAWLGKRYAAGLAAEMKARGSHRPRFSLSGVAASAIALLTYLGVVGIAILGVVTLFSDRLVFVLAILFGLFLLLLAFVMRPRIPRYTEPTNSRDELPALFAFVDRVGDALGAPRLHAIAITPDLNASYSRYGLRQRPIMELGLPLFTALSPQERVALIGHELGHGINGDPARSLLTWNATLSLVEAAAVLEPESVWPASEEGLEGYVAIPVRLFQLAISRLVLGLALAQLLLCFRDSQRAEYYADAVAADVAGTPGLLGLFERLHAVRSATYLTWVGETADPFARITAALTTLPDREIERLRRIGRIQGQSIDASHPPTAFREDVRKAAPARSARVTLTEAESQRIDDELASFRAPAGKAIVDAYQASLYY